MLMRHILFLFPVSNNISSPCSSCAKKIKDQCKKAHPEVTGLCPEVAALAKGYFVYTVCVVRERSSCQIVNKTPRVSFIMKT